MLPLPPARFEPARRHGRGGQRVAVVPVHGVERIARHPFVAVRHDLVVVAADEVPPHDDLLVERLTAEEQQPRRLPGAYRQPGAAGAEVEQRSGAQRDAVHLDGARHREHRVLEVGYQGKLVIGAGTEDRLRADQRAVGPGGRDRGAERAQEHDDGQAVPAHRGQGRVVLEVRTGVAVPVGQRGPELDAVQRGGVVCRRLLGVGDRPPGGHQVELARADELPRAEAVAVQYLAGEQPAHRLQAGVRMRRYPHAGAPGEVFGAVVVQEAPGADHAAAAVGQGPGDGHPARAAQRDVDGGQQVTDGFGGDGGTPAADGLLGSPVEVAHAISPNRARSPAGTRSTSSGCRWRYPWMNGHTGSTASPSTRTASSAPRASAEPYPCPSKRRSTSVWVKVTVAPSRWYAAKPASSPSA